MKFKWLKKSPSKSAVAFFGGFACDERLLSACQLPGIDVCILYDYRSFDMPVDFSGYENVYVVGWSFGVKVADALCAGMKNVKLRTALCGTATPIDDKCGIPAKIFDLTLRSFDGRACEKFLQRVCGAEAENAVLMCRRSAVELKNELTSLADFCAKNPRQLSKWDYAFACQDDKIFSPAALSSAFENVCLWIGAHLNPRLFSYALSIPQTGGRFAGAFKKAASDYAKHSVVQKNVALFLREKLSCEFPNRRFKCAFEFGCGTGFLSAQIKKYMACESFVLNDLSLEMCQGAAASLGGRYNAGPISEIALDFSPDIILSASCLQWLDDKPAVFKKLYKAAAPGAVLAVGSFGPENFAEFSKFGHSPISYDTFDEFCDQISGAGFKVVFSQNDVFRFLFKTPRDVLRHVRDTGVNGASAEFWTPQRLRAFEKAYVRIYSDCGGVHLTYNPMCAIAIKEK